jgi:hypothetical protein
MQHDADETSDGMKQAPAAHFTNSRGEKTIHGGHRRMTSFIKQSGKLSCD